MPLLLHDALRHCWPLMLIYYFAMMFRRYFADAAGFTLICYFARYIIDIRHISPLFTLTL